jgi:CRISPR-associated endonuclease Cas1
MTNADNTVTTATPRVIYESRPLTPDDITEDTERRAEVYGRADAEGVAVVDGFGARIAVERGHLELHDGVGADRRVRRYPKVDPPRRLVVGIGTVGTLSFDAVRWCSQVGTSLVVLGIAGAILAAGPPGRDDARLLRAQALALYGPAGLAVTRYLISEKLRGQARVLRTRLGEADAASTLVDLLGAIEASDSIDGVRQLEAAGANVYFAALERRTEVIFARKDLPRVPGHWSRFNGRRSSVNPGSPRSATDPAGAVLNYAYKLAEIEAGLAACRIGLNPAIGILHADVAGRPSFACDLMEAVRPVVDAHVLDVLAGPLRKREFTEDARGVVRCLAPITHRLAEAMPSYAVVLGPVVEHVASLLATSSPYDVNVPTVLSGAKHKAAARKRVDAERNQERPQPAPRGPNPGGMTPRGRRRPKPSESPPLPLRACRRCGGRLPVDPGRDRPRINWCADCLRDRRDELGSSLPDAARVAAEQFAELTGVLPAHTPEAQASRSVANAAQRAAQAAYLPTDDGEADAAWFRSTVQPKLALMTLPAIAKATGASTSAASKWRAGRAAPHPRHWSALAELVEVEIPT